MSLSLCISLSVCLSLAECRTLMVFLCLFLSIFYFYAQQSPFSHSFASLRFSSLMHFLTPSLSLCDFFLSLTVAFLRVFFVSFPSLDLAFLNLCIHINQPFYTLSLSVYFSFSLSQWLMQRLHTYTHTLSLSLPYFLV